MLHCGQQKQLDTHSSGVEQAIKNLEKFYWFANVHNNRLNLLSPKILSGYT